MSRLAPGASAVKPSIQKLLGISDEELDHALPILAAAAETRAEAERTRELAAIFDTVPRLSERERAFCAAHRIDPVAYAERRDARRRR